MMNVKKEARRDAHEFARAQMYYGDGAGIRRRLIIGTVQSKIDRDPAYEHAFAHALDKEDMAEHAKKARKERRRKDVTDSTLKNTKALATGNYQNLQTGALVVLGVAYIAHQTGLDKVMYEKTKMFLRKGKEKLRRFRHKNATIHNFTIYNQEQS